MSTIESLDAPAGTRRAPLAALIAASAVARLGRELTVVAVPWFVLRATGSTARTGLASTLEGLATLAAGFGAGVLVDRLGFRRAGVLGDLACAAPLVLVPALYRATGLAFWQLLALVFIAYLLTAPGDLARQGLVPELAARARLGLARANAAVQAGPRVAALCGPALAGATIALLGASNALWGGAVAFACSAALLGLLIPPAAGVARGRAAREPYLAALRDGWRFVRRQRTLRAISVTFAITNFLDEPVSLLLLVYADRVLGGAAALGLLFAALGAGGVAGALLFGALDRRLPRRLVFLGFPATSAVAYGLIAFTPPLAAIAVAQFAVGFSAGLVNTLNATVVHERAPRALLGRVAGLRSAIALAAAPLGAGATAALLGAVELRAIFAGIAALFMAVTAVVAATPALRDWRAPAGVPGGE